MFDSYRMQQVHRWTSTAALAAMAFHGFYQCYVWISRGQVRHLAQ